jgi:hypothetical protein
VVLDILNDVKCVYRGDSGKIKHTMLRLSMHTMRGKRGNYIASKIRSMYAAGCDFKVNYGLIGWHTKQIIGAPTKRGRIPLRSTGFDLNDDPEEIERYTHQKYLVVRGNYRGDKRTRMVFTGSSNWASLGASEDEIIFSVRGGKVADQWLKNWNFMWQPPYSRDAYTTTYTVNRVPQVVDGRVRLVPQVQKVTTVEPDRVHGAGSHWEND